MAGDLTDEWLRTLGSLNVSETTRVLLCNATRALEDYHWPTAEHCKRVGILAVEVGRHENLPLKPLFYGGSLHDRGKLNVTRELLDKTACWTQQDSIALQDHPSDGYDITIREGMVVTAGLIVRHHTFQGNSYPPDVPPAPPYMAAVFDRLARIIALVDFYDAAHRPNSDGLPDGEAIMAKVLAANPDVNPLVETLYEKGIFSAA